MAAFTPEAGDVVKHHAAQGVATQVQDAVHHQALHPRLQAGYHGTGLLAHCNKSSPS